MNDGAEALRIVAGFGGRFYLRKQPPTVIHHACGRLCSADVNGAKWSWFSDLNFERLGFTCVRNVYQIVAVGVR